jgi:hypothetical protein
VLADTGQEEGAGRKRAVLEGKCHPGKVGKRTPLDAIHPSMGLGDCERLRLGHRFLPMIGLHAAGTNDPRTRS